MVFISTIPFNVYAILSIIMVFALCYFNFDFGKMKNNDLVAETTGDLHAGIENAEESSEEVICAYLFAHYFKERIHCL